MVATQWKGPTITQMWRPWRDSDGVLWRRCASPSADKFLPDLSDAATLGCLRKIVHEAGPDDHDHIRWDDAEGLVNALEAAHRSAKKTVGKWHQMVARRAQT